MNGFEAEEFYSPEEAALYTAAITSAGVAYQEAGDEEPEPRPYVPPVIPRKPPVGVPAISNGVAPAGVETMDLVTNGEGELLPAVVGNGVMATPVIAMPAVVAGLMSLGFFKALQVRVKPSGSYDFTMER